MRADAAELANAHSPALQLSCFLLIPGKTNAAEHRKKPFATGLEPLETLSEETVPLELAEVNGNLQTE